MSTAQANAEFAAQENIYNTQMRNAYNAQLASMNPVGNVAKLAASYFKDNAAYRRGFDTLKMIAPNARISKPKDSTFLSRILGESPKVDWRTDD